MSKQSNPSTTRISKVLRGRMTRQERRLWYDFLKKLPIPVYRQKPLDDHIVDFYIAKVKLVIELDGNQHYSAAGAEKDASRDAYLEKTGNLVVRYSNHDIDACFEGVCLDIIRHIRARGMGDKWDPFDPVSDS